LNANNVNRVEYFELLTQSRFKTTGANQLGFSLPVFFVIPFLPTFVSFDVLPSPPVAQSKGQRQKCSAAAGLSTADWLLERKKRRETCSRE
jgi:hypothetical protein